MGERSHGHYEGLKEGMHMATTAQKRSIWWKNSIINGLLMLSWFVFAIALSSYNKWMFSPDKYNFPFPFFVTFLHMVVQFVLSATVRFFWPAIFRPLNSPSTKDYVKKVIPTAIATAVDVGLSNWSVELITLSLYTMAKSSSLVFVLFFALLLRLENFSLRLISVVFLIVIGVILSVAAETTVVVSGLILVLTASAASGLRWALTQLLLKSPTMGMNNPAATLFWLTPAMGTILALMSFFVEGWGAIFSSSQFTRPHILQTIGYLLLPGHMAFIMVLSEYTIIQRTGAVPMSIAGIFKEATTLTAAGIIFGDSLNRVNLIGVFITFIGIGLFTYHKYRKSMDSPIPLDAHGNPIQREEGDEDLELSSRDEFERVPLRYSTTHDD